MKCPLFGLYDHERKGDKVSVAPDCIDHDCAWWHPQNKTCAILTLAQGSASIDSMLRHLGGETE